jgi:hypothetical protein
MLRNERPERPQNVEDAEWQTYHLPGPAPYSAPSQSVADEPGGPSRSMLRIGRWTRPLAAPRVLLFCAALVADGLEDRLEALGDFSVSSDWDEVNTVKRSGLAYVPN